MAADSWLWIEFLAVDSWQGCGLGMLWEKLIGALLAALGAPGVPGELHNHKVTLQPSAKVPFSFDFANYYSAFAHQVM